MVHTPSRHPLVRIKWLFADMGGPLLKQSKRMNCPSGPRVLNESDQPPRGDPNSAYSRVQPGLGFVSSFLLSYSLDQYPSILGVEFFFFSPFRFRMSSYDVLQVSFKATEEEIRIAYKTMVSGRDSCLEGW